MGRKLRTQAKIKVEPNIRELSGSSYNHRTVGDLSRERGCSLKVVEVRRNQRRNPNRGKNIRRTSHNQVSVRGVQS